MAKVITMGEIMLRLSTPNNEKFIQADEFDINYGGGEANSKSDGLPEKSSLMFSS